MKDFTEWHKKKSALNERQDTADIFFREREIWWCALGKNIGFEQDGKGEEFRRPVLILKKFNQYVFIAVPLTTKNKNGKYYVGCDLGDGLERKAIISQLRLIDSKRLIDKMTTLEESRFQAIRKAVKDIL